MPASAAAPARPASTFAMRAAREPDRVSKLQVASMGKNSAGCCSRRYGTARSAPSAARSSAYRGSGGPRSGELARMADEGESELRDEDDPQDGHGETSRARERGKRQGDRE